MSTREDRFVALSARLTGVGPVSLAGTGQVAAYLAVLDGLLPAGLLDDLLTAGEADGDGDGVEALLADKRLGPVARGLILLWYRGAWTPLPPAWRAAHGASAADTGRVISADAYAAGLQWLVAGAHAPGANQQGFGAWALPPRAGWLR